MVLGRMLTWTTFIGSPKCTTNFNGQIHQNPHYYGTPSTLYFFSLTTIVFLQTTCSLQPPLSEPPPLKKYIKYSNSFIVTTSTQIKISDSEKTYFLLIQAFPCCNHPIQALNDFFTSHHLNSLILQVYHKQTLFLNRASYLEHLQIHFIFSFTKTIIIIRAKSINIQIKH